MVLHFLCGFCITLKVVIFGETIITLTTLFRLLKRTKKRIFREVPLDSKDEKSVNYTMLQIYFYFPLWLSLAHMFSSDDSWAD